MKAITLWQPYAQLMVTRAEFVLPMEQPVKWIETRSWPAPAPLIGQRIAIHAAKREMTDLELDVLSDAEWPVDVPTCRTNLGRVVGSGVVRACVPMVGARHSGTGREPHLLVHGRHDPDVMLICRPGEGWSTKGSVLSSHFEWQTEDVRDQRPFGHFEPGRWAWLFDDLAATTERCPACWGTGYTADTLDRHVDLRADCPTCERAGRCAPIPARGAQRIWNWNPTEGHVSR